MSDILADICGIPQDKAAALRLLAEREAEIVRDMNWVGDVVEVPIYMDTGVKIAVYQAESRGGRMRARFVGFRA